jgi:anti-anti-sigma factor
MTSRNVRTAKARRIFMDHPARNVSATAYSAWWVVAPPLGQGADSRAVVIDSPPFPTGTISVIGPEGERVLRLAGEVDAAAVDAFDKSPARPQGPPERGFTVVDVSEVTFIDCAGLRFIVRQSQATGGGTTRPVLRQAPVPVRKLLKLTDLESLFDFAP